MQTGHTSFRALFGDGRRVEIPVIQRDYAQGRSDEHSREVRGRFLDALAEALDPTAKITAAVDLDFVYGRWNVRAKTLEPLDGQQRLTTLFLLHWYLACLDGAFDEFRSWMTLPGGGPCFTYRTRPAAREFFDALVLAPVPPAALGDEPQALSLWLTDAVWFVRNWLRDPTVRGCLTMFDAIHQRLHTAKGAWSRLVCETSPAITFHLLLLENFNHSQLRLRAYGLGLRLTAEKHGKVMQLRIHKTVTVSAHWRMSSRPTAVEPVKLMGRDQLTVNPPTLFGKPREIGRRIGDLPADFRERLALLGGHELRQIVLGREHQVMPAAQDRRALGRGQRPPGRPDPVRGRDGAPGLGGAHRGDLADGHAGGGIDDGEGVAGLGLGPATVDQCLVAQQGRVIQLHGIVLAGLD